MCVTPPIPAPLPTHAKPCMMSHRESKALLMAYVGPLHKRVEKEEMLTKNLLFLSYSREGVLGSH